MNLLLLVFAVPLISSATATATSPDMMVALDEMQKADFYAFVMLINMAPPDLIQANITFLMPNDKSLTNLGETSVTDFLLRHSIPWPLLFDHMMHFPTGSLIPTSTPGLVLKVTNDGRRRFFFNNVRVIGPNICTKGSSIRCHGIDEVVQPALMPNDCSRCPPPPRASPPPLPAPLPPSSNATTPVASSSPPSSSSGGGSPVDAVGGGSPSESSSSQYGRHRPYAAGVVCLVIIIFFML